MSEVPQSHGPAASHRDESEPFPKRVYNDAKTWFPMITAQEVEDLIKKFQLEGKAVNYESLAMLIGMGDWESVQVLLDASLRGPAPTLIDVNEYLDRHLINVSKKCDMMKKECRDYVDKLSQRVRPQPASCKRNVAFSYSPRGSGKTQLVKYFLSTRRTNAVKWGRVIVRCCEKGKQESWLRFVKAEAKSDPATVVQFLDRMPGTDKGLCELIRAHVKAVTGREQNMSNYVDAVTAYKTWMSATASHFGIPADAEDVDPLIVLDVRGSCQPRAQQYEIHGRRIVHAA
ncbi:Bodo-specific multi-copy gene family, putative [Bodo saltans]|uniref:Bodo-specific multi-copy gene family, putative n=1 Tax=Bodo saltans TaxID=75058 RepID=A0A0S4JMK6_BODSA|nr:Bodo-specific multi-copy gene family, putative [Bodo saltans]|eukprot:CUG92749.1 Bodo-specific multi-copy gene family, putative [Bodo saltans]